MTTVTDLGVGSSYLADDVLLSTEMARDLYHGVAETCPIVDVHNHLPALDIASDRRWANLADLWLADDHYKWRAMRQAGVAEELITGDADPWDRFQAWAATMPRSVRNPLYVWTHLELRRVFGIDLVLSPATAREIWEEANRQLPSWSAQRLLAHFRVDRRCHHRRSRGRPRPPRRPASLPDDQPAGHGADDAAGCRATACWAIR